ncbi:hypothetical protein BGZ49_010430 [Haplosporangium sp. Z 27]|nr:hypothetical protein BGZ49_010430 [Haplosporangium sp. Z 27]
MTEQASSNHSATVSHHPNALNRYPFSIPSISAKLDQPPPDDGTDALSSLWKKTTPIQEPYFRTPYTIASQHTLSTLGGVLFSLDEVPTDFTKDMYIAMRNRIFELEAKSVDYSPFSSSRKRPLEDYPDRYGYDYELGHYSKKPIHGYSSETPLHPNDPIGRDYPRSPTHRYPSSYPSWYTPEEYTNISHPHHSRDREYRPTRNPQHEQQSQRPNSPPPSSEIPARSHERTSHSSSRPQFHDPPSQDLQPFSHPDEKALQGPSSSNGSYPPNHQPHSSHILHQSVHITSPQSSHPHQYQPHSPQRLSQGRHSQMQGYTHASNQQQHQLHQSTQLNNIPNGIIAPVNVSEARQSGHQQRHRAQQQAQSAHSRSYHLHKHMQMLDQQRAAQNQQQQQQQQQEQQNQQQQQQKQRQLQPQENSQKAIQRNYQPHQQMYPGYHHPIPIRPHPPPPPPTPSQQQQRQLQLQQQKQQQKQRQSQVLQATSGSSHQLTLQQQFLQRYQKQRQLQQKQQQLRQLQLMRSRQAISYPTQRNSIRVAANSGSHSPTPPRVFDSRVDKPIKKATRPLECSNCMALDSVSWKHKADLHNPEQEGSIPSGETTITSNGPLDEGSKLLCPACTQYLRAHGKSRPVPPFRANFLKKIHTRFKRELQEVRFQGWQDAQILEIEDRMVEREFQMVFNGLDESDASLIQNQQLHASGSPAPIVLISESSTSSNDPPAKGGTSLSTSTPETSKNTESVAIKIEEVDESPDSIGQKSKPENVEVRTYQSEASVGELFGQRWRTEPVVGYTLVHFGGSDRTRMVPMNPTVPSLTITFDRSKETITFAFRVLVNGLCLLSSGGGPPALHMPEMADDEESEGETDVVVVPDNDKDDLLPSPTAAIDPTAPSDSKTSTAVSQTSPELEMVSGSLKQSTSVDKPVSNDTDLAEQG